MEPLIDTLILNEFFLDYQVQAKDGFDLRLGPLGKINIFVGANNSGKSRLMRVMAKLELRSLVWIPRLSDTNPWANNMRNTWSTACNEILRIVNAEQPQGGFPSVKAEAECFLSLLKQSEPSPTDLGRCAAFLQFLSTLPGRLKATETWRSQMLTALGKVAQQRLSTLNNLSTEAQQITAKIYAFIESCNSD